MPTDLEHQLSVIATTLDRHVAAVTIEEVRADITLADIAVVGADHRSRRRLAGWALAAAAAALIVGVVVATRHDPSSRLTSGGTSIDLSSLDPADEIALTSIPINVTTTYFTWTTEITTPGARPFMIGTPTDALIELNVGQDLTSEQAHRLLDGAICVGRGGSAATSAGCGHPLEVTFLVVESTGAIDTMVWRGLPADAAVVVLEANGRTYWEHPAADTAAFDAPWCDTDSCGRFVLTAYDATGHQVATTSGG